MSESDQDDVPISKMVTRLKQQQQQEEAARNGDSKSGTPSPSPAAMETEKGQTIDDKQVHNTAGSANGNADKQHPDINETTKEHQESTDKESAEGTDSPSSSTEKRETDDAVEKAAAIADNRNQNEPTSQTETTIKEEIPSPRTAGKTDSEETNKSPANVEEDTNAPSISPGVEDPKDSAFQKGDSVKTEAGDSVQTTPVKESTQSKEETEDAALSRASPMEVETEKDTAFAPEECQGPHDKLAETALAPETVQNPSDKTTEAPPGESIDRNTTRTDKKEQKSKSQREESEIDNLHDAFPLMVLPKKRKKGSHNRARKRKEKATIQIQFDGGANGVRRSAGIALRGEEKRCTEETIRRFETGLYGSFLDDFDSDEDNDSSRLLEFEDSLAFYSETHEDQDPVFIEFNQKKEKNRLEGEMVRLEEEDKSGKAEIERIISTQLKEKQLAADKTFEKIRNKTAMDERRDLEKLLQMYNQRNATHQSRINDNVKMLGRRQHQELQKAAMQYRQQAHQQRLPEQVATAEWANASQQLKAKQQRQIQELTAKGDEMKKKCEVEYSRDQEKLRNQHAKKKREMEQGVIKLVARMHNNFKQMRQRHLCRHGDKIKKVKEGILERLRALDKVDSKDDGEDKAPSPAGAVQEDRMESDESPAAKLTIAPLGEKDGKKAAALVRHKHRKSLLAAIPKQLSVEIHNEGIWISSLVEKKDKQNERTSRSSSEAEGDCEFLPWGVQARIVLHSIVCGEIPVGYGSDRFDFGDAVATQGGHLKCVVVDLRTSDATATSERATAMIEHEEASIVELERKSKRLRELLVEAENNHSRAETDQQECSTAVDKAVKEHAKIKQNFANFKVKFKDYFGPDGTPVMTASPGDRQKLLTAIRRFKAGVEGAEARENSVRVALSEANAYAQKMNSLVRQMQKTSAAAVALLKRMKGDGRSGRGGRSRSQDAVELERAANRVSDAIAVFRRTADRRKQQWNQKRSSRDSSTWVQALPGVPGPLKRSLWHKMHRRRQQIVLRPTMASTVLGLKKSVRSMVSDKQDSTSSIEDRALLAEQLFLLTAFPVKSEPLSSVPVPPSGDSWAEPGCHVVLDVPKEKRPSSILPCTPSFPVFQYSHSEFCSGPGRQAASMLSLPYLRTLTSPLSATTQATSMAETNPSVRSSPHDFAERDPLRSNEAALLAGYKFPAKTTSSRASSQSRKRSSAAVSKEEPDASTTSKRKASGDTATSGRSVAGASERRSSSKGERTKRSRSKTNTAISPKAKTSRNKTDTGPSMSRQTLEQSYMQQQGTSVSLGGGGVYSQQQQSQQSMEQQAAQYSQYMKQRDALQMQQQLPPASSPPQAGQQQMSLHQLQSQQQQMQGPPQQQLLPQPHQQYAMPQQQFHQQQQMAQMRMMQQQQGAVPPPYAQQQSPQGMQAFFPPPMSQQGNRRESYGSQQPMPMSRSGSVNMGQSVMSQQPPNSPSPARRTSQQQGGDDSQHDPLLFLK